MTTTKAAFRTVAEADVFAAHKAAAKVIRPAYKAEMDHAATLAPRWALLARCGRPGAAERFAENLHMAMGYRPEHTKDELTF